MSDNLDFFATIQKEKIPFYYANSEEWKKFNLSAEYHQNENNQIKWRTLYNADKGLARTFVQAQTLHYLENKANFVTPTQLIEWPSEIDVNTPIIDGMPAENIPVRTSVENIDCLYMAEKLAKEGKKPLVLNMANQTDKGGGYNHGCGAQEEDLFRRTSLYCTLDPSFYKPKIEAAEKNSAGFGEFNVLYTQQVTVLRKGMDKNYAFYKNEEQFDISVVSGAAYNLGDVASEVKAGSGRYIQGMEKKIIMQLEAARLFGHRNIVLSAFGCGAFKNKPTFVAELYKKVLNYPRYQHAFDQVIFAIIPNPGAAASADNYLPFKTVFENVAPTAKIEEPVSTKESSSIFSPAIYLGKKILSFFWTPVSSMVAKEDKTAENLLSEPSSTYAPSFSGQQTTTSTKKEETQPVEKNIATLKPTQ